MPILRHLDKAVFALLCVLAAWYGFARYQGLSRSAMERDAVLAAARNLEAEVAGIGVPPPPQDPGQFIQAIRGHWGDIPGMLQVSLDARHFYPGARRRE